MIAYAVVQRTREVGVRVALGARRAHVCWLVSRGAARQLALGLAIGLAGAFAMGRLMHGILSSVDASDPIGLVAIALVLVVVSLAACLPRVRRAVRLNPIDALRAERRIAGVALLELIVVPIDEKEFNERIRNSTAGGRRP